MTPEGVAVWRTPISQAPTIYPEAIIVGCLSYYLADGETRHVTKFMFELDRQVPALWARIDPTAGDVPAAELLLSVNPGLPWEVD